ncbi:hypothetical protein Gotri_001293 [Gossypium trilobum]|uniref:RNase H type-1 domain-containing protein n=1 Tax=Gossypium trilobum TaxID=34281 RepID=A0A7J9FE88_9ROSI|nr:hypothetical protein [Gossypium trilobum]
MGSRTILNTFVSDPFTAKAIACLHALNLSREMGGEGNLATTANNGIEKISDLIDQSVKTWKVKLIKGLFNRMEAHAICCIPLSIYTIEDKMVWCIDNSGMYTVETMTPIWKPPQEPFVKVNFDAAFKANLYHSYSSFVIRNSRGSVMGSGTVLNKFVSDPFTAEAIACL